MIKVGDRIGQKGKLIEITERNIVIEEMTDRDREIVVIRVENGKQRVELNKVVKDKKQPYAPEHAGQSGVAQK